MQFFFNKNKPCLILASSTKEKKNRWVGGYDDVILEWFLRQSEMGKRYESMWFIIVMYFLTTSNAVLETCLLYMF